MQNFKSYLATDKAVVTEAIKLGSKVKMHAPGKDYHGQVGRVGEIRHGAYKGAPKTYTVDYGDRLSVQLDKKNVKLNKEDTKTVSEAIKGWKNAHADIAKSRAAASAAAKPVQLHALTKSGEESGMHDARKSFDSPEAAHKYHDNLHKLNPGKTYKHNMYVDGKRVKTLGEGENKQIKGGDPCWKGYEMIGMKPGKDGRKVPNCVPANKSVKESLKADLMAFRTMIEEASYKVDVEGLPTMYVTSTSPSDVKTNLRKILKKADMIRSVDRITDAEVKKSFRLKAIGKDEEGQ